MEPNYKKAYFIGIGGIGMSALAQMLSSRGAQVSGSDTAESPVTALLTSKGIAVAIGQKAEQVPVDADVVVYSDAVGEDNPERVRAKERGIPQFSYFAMLGKVSANKRTIAVAGTHGKTTTTGMLAKILKDGGASPTAIVGSIVKDFSSNYVAGGSDVFVVEACEYRDHLLELNPEILVITNLDWDHTDWFPSIAAMQETFRKAAEKVPEGGTIITNPNDPIIAGVLGGTKAKIVDYTQEPAYTLRLVGHFNVMNARAAASAARLVSSDISSEVIWASLASFEGSWRRFEYKGKTKRGTDVYDDYAHHPTAVKETLAGLRTKGKRKSYVAFQPHLFSRTRDLMDDFAGAFQLAHEVLIAPIYAAREKDDGTISNQTLVDKITAQGKRARAATFEEIERILSTEPGPDDVIMTMGAGNIYKVADALVAQKG